MEAKLTRTRAIRTDEVERLRQAKGLSLDRLAGKAGVDQKTLRRWLNGETQPYISSIGMLAKALDVTPEVLFADAPILPTERFEAEFRVSLNVAGTLKSRDQLAKLTALPQSVVESLAAAGIAVQSHAMEMAVTDDEGVSICYYVSSDQAGQHTWYVLVAPLSKRDELCAATQRSDGVDIRQFGDVISTGSGPEVPKEVRALLHRLYPTAILPP